MTKGSKQKIVKKRNLALSFLGGLLFTILLVVAVPVICRVFISPVVTDIVGETTFASLSSGAIVSIIILVVLVMSSMLLGGSAIFKRFGLTGVAALLCAYYILSEYTDLGVKMADVVIPMTCIMLMILWSWHKSKASN